MITIYLRVCTYNVGDSAGFSTLKLRAKIFVICFVERLLEKDGEKPTFVQKLYTQLIEHAKRLRW